MCKSMTERINFDKKVKMGLACSKDDLRPLMGCIYFKDGYAYASDGLILVKNKVSEISTISEDQIAQLNDVYLHAETYDKVVKYDTIDISAEGIECTSGDKKAFFYFQVMEDAKYPNADSVLNDMLNKPAASIPVCVFDTDLLSRIQKAMPDAKNLRFRFKQDKHAVHAVVESENSDYSSVGIIMGRMLLKD